MASKLSIIILSFNTKKLILDCLRSIYETAANLNLEVIVIDNASTDGSAQAIKKHFSQVRLIKNKTNLGFSKANNQGIKRAKGEFILLLNSDTKVKQGAIKNLWQFMESHPSVGIASAQLLNPDGSIQQSGGFLPRLSNIFAWMLFIDDLPVFKQLFWSYHKTNPAFYQKTRKIGWVQGAAMMLRKEVIEEVGPLDKRLFMYGEDVDLCLRARKAGWQVWSVAEAKVTHYQSQSSKGLSQNAILGEYKAIKYLFQKHQPHWQLAILKLLLKLGAALRMLIFGTILKDSQRYDIYRQAFSLVG